MGLLENFENTGLHRWLKYRLNQRLIAFLRREALAGKSGAVVGELACGSGYGAHLLAQLPEVGRSVAMDISRELHDQAKFTEFSAEFVLGDLYNPPFEPETFDLTWNSSAIEHFPDPAGAIRKMAELTRPGGFVFVGIPYFYGPLASYHVAPTEAMREWLGRPYTDAELGGMMRNCELAPVGRIVYFFRFFLGLLARKVIS